MCFFCETRNNRLVFAIRSFFFFMQNNPNTLKNGNSSCLSLVYEFFCLNFAFAFNLTTTNT